MRSVHSRGPTSQSRRPACCLPRAAPGKTTLGPSQAGPGYPGLCGTARPGALHRPGPVRGAPRGSRVFLQTQWLCFQAFRAVRGVHLAGPFPASFALGFLDRLRALARFGEEPPRGRRCGRCAPCRVQCGPAPLPALHFLLWRLRRHRPRVRPRPPGRPSRPQLLWLLAGGGLFDALCVFPAPTSGQVGSGAPTAVAVEHSYDPGCGRLLGSVRGRGIQRFHPGQDKCA